LIEIGNLTEIGIQKLGGRDVSDRCRQHISISPIALGRRD